MYSNNFLVTSDTILKIDMFLSDCCKIIKREMEFFKYGKYHSSKKVGLLDGYNTDPYFEYFDLTALKDSNYKLNENRLIIFINKIFPLITDTVKVKTINNKHFIISKLDNTNLIELN
jgi:hypothetical protein